MFAPSCRMTAMVSEKAIEFRLLLRMGWENRKFRDRYITRLTRTCHTLYRLIKIKSKLYEENTNNLIYINISSLLARFRFVCYGVKVFRNRELLGDVGNSTK